MRAFARFSCIAIDAFESPSSDCHKSEGSHFRAEGRTVEQTLPFLDYLNRYFENSQVIHEQHNCLFDPVILKFVSLSKFIDPFSAKCLIRLCGESTKSHPLPFPTKSHFIIQAIPLSLTKS